MESLKPDVFLIYNDIIVTCRACNALLGYRSAHPETRFLSYLDLVYPYEKLALVRHVDRNTDTILVFSECWRRNLVDMGICTEKVRVFPHGFSANLFYPLAADVAKAYFGFAKDDFVLLNANRNTYRKAQDVAIRAFVDFLIRENWDPRIKLFLHCAMTSSSGYNLMDVFEIEACRAKVPLDKLQARICRFPERPEGVQDAEMNLLYNATDVGLNTGMGEGFGLCQLEHAALGKPQIVSKVGALADIFADGGAILVEPNAWIRASNTLDEHSGDLGICAAADFTAAMSRYFHDSKKREEDGMWGAQVLPARYAWSKVLGTLKETLSHI
jgi:glycosyltransferase involved in cell wall biosynthesis